MTATAKEAGRTAPVRLPRVAHARLEVSLGQASSAGVKAANQDFHGALVPEATDLAGKGVAVAIADGISTSALGAVAAETAVRGFLTDYYATSPAWSVRTAAQRVIAATNSWMNAQNERQRPREEGHDRERGALICTFGALVLKGRHAHAFHVGDTQISLVTRGCLEPLTEPHRVHLGGGESYLARALGADRSVELDYRLVTIQAGDLFILSTDGVHEHLAADQMLAALAGSADLDQAARTMVQLARASGSQDNLTVQLLRVDGVPDGDVAELLGGELALPPAPRLAAGDRFEDYTILRELHAGSRSHVYLARADTDGPRVVLKVPATDHADNPDELSALLLEEWIARRVSHPNLLPAAQTGRVRRHIYSIAPYLEGETLDQWLRDHPRPSLAKVRDVIGQLAAGLLALHRREMLHRDLRPRNVLIDGDGLVRIIDFGSVEVAGLVEVVPATAKAAIYAGTVQYAAPELLLGEAASPQSDLFALGVIAYQMLTGALPYGATGGRATSPASQRRLRYRPATELNPEVPEWVDFALAKAVAIRPSNRYAELSEFTYDLVHPNPLFTRVTRPLLERGSAHHWRVLALLLAAALVLSILSRPEFG